jgi:hypothetical protein
VARKPSDIVNLRLRLPEALRKRLSQDAEKNERSLNSEILYRLGQTYEPAWQEFIAGIERKEEADREVVDRLLQDPGFRDQITKFLATRRRD